MQVYPFTFSFNDLDTGERTVRTVLVGITRTRSKNYVVKASTNWDEGYDVVGEVDDYISRSDYDNLDDMSRCHFFWNCLRHGAIFALLTQTAPFIDLAWNTVTPVLNDLPRPDTKEKPMSELLSIVNNQFLSIHLTQDDNGYT